jgi:hypothetical protein
MDQQHLWTPLVHDPDPHAIQVIIVWKSDGGWHPATVLTRNPDNVVEAIAPWNEPSFGTSECASTHVWNYLADRVRTGAGGNGYSYELTGIVVADVAHIRPVVIALAAEIVWAPHGPFG